MKPVASLRTKHVYLICADRVFRRSAYSEAMIREAAFGLGTTLLRRTYRELENEAQYQTENISIQCMENKKANYMSSNLYL